MESVEAAEEYKWYVVNVRKYAVTDFPVREKCTNMYSQRQC
jgi:hypothetical protein